MFIRKCRSEFLGIVLVILLGFVVVLARETKKRQLISVRNCVHQLQHGQSDIGFLSVCGWNNVSYSNCFEAQKNGQDYLLHYGTCKRDIQVQNNYIEIQKDDHIVIQRRRLMQKYQYSTSVNNNNGGSSNSGSVLDMFSFLVEDSPDQATGQSTQSQPELEQFDPNIPTGFPVPIDQKNIFLPDYDDQLQFQMEIVLGNDSRIRVRNTTMHPFKAIGLVGEGCTGTLIGTRSVLTAAHCVIELSTNKILNDLDFSPGQDADITFARYLWDTVYVPKQWYDGQDKRYDFALIILQKPVQDITPVAFGNECNDPRKQFFSLNIVGYPFEQPPRFSQWATGCQSVRLNCTQKSFLHGCDTSSGMSGAPMFVFRRDSTPQFSIRAIHTAGQFAIQSNFGVILRDEVMEKLNEWMQKYEQ